MGTAGSADDSAEGAMEIKIPDEIAAEIAAVAEKTGQTAESLAAEMLTEAIKMRRVPGILFADGATGRRARVGGTGIEVFEVIDRYELVGQDQAQLKKIFHWLSKHQLTAAIKYYEAYPEEIRARLHTDEEDRAAIEALWRAIPQTSPDWPGRLGPATESVASDARETA